jgi:phytoene dehydrogenase-like protein
VTGWVWLAVPDAVVIGAGPNGLVAANLLADAGLSVVVFEANAQPGGAVRSAPVTVPGFEHDLFSAFYPFAVASPVMRDLGLDAYGLVWRRAPLAVAHPTPEGPAALLSTDPDETAASLDAFAAGDGAAWRRLYRLWQRIESPFMEAFTTPFPPVRAAARLAASVGPRAGARLAHVALLPVRRLAQEWFNGSGGGLLLAGNALHADITPETPGGGAFGWILCSIGQHHGFPIPEGGAGRLTDALVRRLHARGGDVHCGLRVAAVIVRRGRAVGVRLADGTQVGASEGVVADTGAPQLYLDLLDRDHLPRPMLADLERFQYDNSTVKVDWALREPIPWTDPAVRRAGTVHIADSMDLLSEITVGLELQRIPVRPFLVVGQYVTADPTRAPAGADTAWAYSHVPQHTRSDADGELRGRWGRGGARAVRRADGGRDRTACTRLPRPDSRAPHRRPARTRACEREPRRRSCERRNGQAAPADRVPARPRPRAIRDPRPQSLLGLRVRAPGRRLHGASGANAARALLAHRRLSAGAVSRTLERGRRFMGQ